jgi:hypothetical protein
MLLFGTPSKLLDGGADRGSVLQLPRHRLRQALHVLATSSRRRTTNRRRDLPQAGRSRQRARSSVGRSTSTSWPIRACFNWRMDVEDEAVGIELLRYKIECEKAAALLNPQRRSARLSFQPPLLQGPEAGRRLRLRRSSQEVEMEPPHCQAILLVEESGKAFQHPSTARRPHVKLAKYIARLRR